MFYPVKEKFPNASIKNMDEYHSLVKKFDEDYEGTWSEYASSKIDWFKKYDRVLNEDNAPFYKWFEGGELNASYQCIDRHLKTKKDQIAIICEADDGSSKTLTYAELSIEVNKCANMLKNHFKVKKGDRVIIYLPMILESAVVILACARIGAIHSIVFGGFSANALRDRINDAKAKLVITADGAYRKGKSYMLKPIVDDALQEGCECVEKVCVIKRNNEDISWNEDRDEDYHTLIKNQSKECEATLMQSEDPLFLLYTSGSTGKPKGVVHSTAGYMLWAQMTMEWTFDIQQNDTYWCTADIGWITGHTYIIYGPLAAGTTTVMFEGVLTYPDTGRAWDIIQKYKINQFYTAPTAIRLLQKMGELEPKKYDLSSLRILGTVGEPIDKEAWQWYYEVVGNSKCSIVDTWWQTETGGHVLTPLPAATPNKPTSAAFALPGIKAEIIDKNGATLDSNQTGMLCITKPWPSMIRTVYGDDQRFVKTYFNDAKKDEKPVYFSGDGALKDEDGYIFVTGRTDDVINVSGHRLGSAELESAIKKCTDIAEVAVVGKKDPIKGEAIFAYIVQKQGIEYDKQTQLARINNVVRVEIGSIAQIDDIAIVPELPKTRSGKIMRRLLRSIAKGEEITNDISTLENPSIIENIQKIVLSYEL